MLGRTRHEAEVYQARVFVATHSPAPGTRAKDPVSPYFTAGVTETQPQSLSCSAADQSPSKKGGQQPPYEDWSKDELYDRAQEIGIDGRSDMSKPELIDALRNH